MLGYRGFETWRGDAVCHGSNNERGFEINVQGIGKFFMRQKVSD